MKRLRSSDDVDSYGCEKNACKEASNSIRSSSSSHRNFYNKSAQENGIGRKGTISPSRYDRDRPSFLAGDDVGHRDGSRVISRKRSFHGFEGGIERRKGPDNRYADERIYRSESFCLARREFPKGFRSERERPRREGSVSSSWRRFGSRVRDFGADERERGGSLRVGGRDREREKEKERIVKSPSWSRDSGSEQSRTRGVVGADSRDSRSRSKSKSSPAWSKDSESEQSKSVSDVVRKSEEVTVKNGSGSEMEEGELEPEPRAVPKPDNTAIGNGNQEKESADTDNGHMDVKRAIGSREIDKGPDRTSCCFKETEIDSGFREVECEDRDLEEGGTKKEESDDEEKRVYTEENGDLHVEEFRLDDAGKTGVSGDGVEDGACDETDKATEKDDLKERQGSEEVEGGRKPHEEKTNTADESGHLIEQTKSDKVINLEIEVAEAEAPENKLASSEQNKESEMTMTLVAEGSNQTYKDKGKSIAATPTLDLVSAGDGMWTEREARNLSRDSDRNDDMEGPSNRGFELFSTSPVKKSDKGQQSETRKDKKLVLEPLDLSLSLPDVLLPIGAQDAKAGPGSPTGAASVQSFTDTYYTNSDAFTASLSFSGSQSFHHNPSCSMNNNSLDNCEQSVHSRPIFHGMDQICGGAWQSENHNDSHNKEVPMYQRILMNGNGSLSQTQVPQGVSSSLSIQGQHMRVLEDSSKMSNGFERQLSFNKPKDVRSPKHSMGSYENGSCDSFEKKKPMREKHSSGLHRSSTHKAIEQLPVGGTEFVEAIIGHMVTDPIHVMAKKFHDMADKYKAILKQSIREMMLNIEKRAKLHAFQNALQKRSDITMEVLLKSHRTQLEILVALRTGLPEFLRLDSSVSSSELAEIFLNQRCRNLTCKSLLPVEECDCQVCAKKDGFCSACMCLVCEKFDMASNTCSWVGCDLCLHWCHADCALRELYIRSGNGASGVQFYCVVCDHPSEMFGFVKEVFQNFAKDWNRDHFSRELEYVRRIFSSSRDLRGKRLLEIANTMLARLANGADLSDVYNHIAEFLTDFDFPSFINVPVSFGKGQAACNGGNAGPSQDASWLRSVYAVDETPKLERSSSSRSFHGEDKLPMVSEFPRSNPEKEPIIFKELESIIRIKEAEAKMFQSRADDARREAEELRRIVVAKNKKIDDEYMSRINKLHLPEAEDMRKNKLEEFQALERSHRDYFSMKMRMEEDIKDLLRKMELTKRNLAL